MLEDSESSKMAVADSEISKMAVVDSDNGKNKDMLAECMLHGTMDLHDKVEKCLFVVRMVESRITRHQYQLLLVDLHTIYSAMEDEAEKAKNDPIYGPIHCPEELNRTEALDKDLTYFYGKRWRSVVKPTKAALRYAEYIHQIGQSQPSLLLAHAFVRYLGDLSGGQVLKVKMGRCMSMPVSGEGLRFYEFDRVKSAIRLKNYLMARINNLELDSVLFDQLMQEARTAFQLNIDVFDELEPKAEHVMRVANPSKGIQLFEKIWHTSALALYCALIYSLSATMKTII